MNIKQVFFLASIISIVICSCQNNKKENTVEEPRISKIDSGITITKSVKQNISGNASEIIRINTYSNNETFLRIEDANGTLLNSSGASNIDLAPNQPILRPISFKSEDSCYLVDFYVRGSTYGANLSMIVWHGYKKWNIYPLPFERFEIRKISGSNLSEIENFDVKPSEKYLFNEGCLQKK